jgi:hypothetical protein
MLSVTEGRFLLPEIVQLFVDVAVISQLSLALREEAMTF